MDLSNVVSILSISMEHFLYSEHILLAQSENKRECIMLYIPRGFLGKSVMDKIREYKYLTMLRYELLHHLY